MEGEERRWRGRGRKEGGGGRGGRGEKVEGEEVEKGKGKLKPRRIIYPLLIFSPKFLNRVYLSPVLPDGVFDLCEVWAILWVVLP